MRWCVTRFRWLDHQLQPRRSTLMEAKPLLLVEQHPNDGIFRLWSVKYFLCIAHGDGMWVGIHEFIVQTKLVILYHIILFSWWFFLIQICSDVSQTSWFLAATKQLYEWSSPSVRLSVCHTFLTMFPSSYHHEIFRSYYQWQKWRPCKRSRSEVKDQGHRGQHPT